MISFTYNLVVLRRATLASISLLILCIVGFFPLDLASHIIFHTIERNHTTGSSKLVSASNFRRSAPSAVISGMSVLTTSKQFHHFQDIESKSVSGLLFDLQSILQLCNKLSYPLPDLF